MVTIANILYTATNNDNIYIKKINNIGGRDII